MKVIAIEGIDGSGKSTVAGKIKERYEAEGLRANVVAPYRLASKINGGDLYPLWENEIGALSAVRILKNVITCTTERAEDSGVDVLIFDRHWMTAFTEIADKPKAIEEWGDNFVQTAFLRVNPDEAIERAEGDSHEAWMSTEGLEGYANKYAELCKTYGQHILGVYRNDNDVQIDIIVDSIVWDMNIRR